MTQLMDGGFLRDTSTHALVVTSLGPTVISSPGAAVDARAAIQPKIDAANPDNGGSGIVDLLLGPGTFLLNTTGPLSLFRNATGIRIRGSGSGATTIKLSATCPRAFDLTRTADFDTFQNIEIADLTVDCDNILGATNNHVVLGNMIAGGVGQRVNIRAIRVRRVNAINVPHGAAGSGGPYRFGIFLGSGHLASSEGTRTSIRDVIVEDFDMQGGNVAFAAIGTTAPGGSVTAGLGVNVFHDRIHVNRLNHDTLTVPSGTASGNDAHVQLGGYGFGDVARITDLTGTNTWDVGIEIDGFMDALVARPAITDSFNSKVLFRNFRAPTNVAEQRNRVEAPTFKNVNYDPRPGESPVAGYSPGVSIGGDAVTAGYIFGHAEVVDPMFRFENPFALFGETANANSVGHAIDAKNTRYLSLTVRNAKIAAPNLAVANADVQRFASFVDVVAAYSGARIEIDGIHFDLAGVRSGGQNVQWFPVRVQGSSIVATVDRVTSDLSGLTGLTTANDAFYWVLSGVTQSTTAAGSISRVIVRAAPGSNANQNGVFLGASFATPASPNQGAFTIDRCAFGLLNSSGADYTIPAGAGVSVRVRDPITSRAGGNGGVVTSVASAGTITLPPTDPSFITVTGTTTITSVTASWPGRIVTLQFSGALTFTDGSNLKLAGNFVTTADDTITLVCDGTNWSEIARAVN